MVPGYARRMPLKWPREGSDHRRVRSPGVPDLRRADIGPAGPAGRDLPKAGFSAVFSGLADRPFVTGFEGRHHFV